MSHVSHWLLLTLAAFFVIAGVVEIRYLRRGVGSRWRLLSYIAFGLAALGYAVQST